MRNKTITRELALDAETINGSASVESDPILVDYAENFSYIAIVSGTTPNVTLKYQITQSMQSDSSLVCTGPDVSSTWYTPKSGGSIDTSIVATNSNGFSPAA